MEPIIAAIALICGEHICSSVVYEPRFKDQVTCEAFLFTERSRRSKLNQQVVLDDCIITTEERIKEFL
jgi:hypothetical protein